MKKKILLLTIIFSAITVLALSNSFSLDTDTLSFSSSNRNKDVKESFNKEYRLNYTIDENNSEKKEELKKLAKKTTYLLFGDFNNNNESSAHFYNRQMDFYASRYNPNLPEEPSDLGEEDKYKTERMYKTVASFVVPQIFNQVSEYGITYSSFGDISVSFKGDVAICIVDLPNVKSKIENKSNPMKYEYRRYNLKMYYAYYKQDDEWRLWYIYGEDSDDMMEYVDNTSTMESKQLSIAPVYNTILENVYNFDKINELDEDIINSIYEKNKNNIVYINAMYNNYIKAISNGFFISDGLLVTTWSFLQKALIDAQYISIINANKSYMIQGIVTINPEADIAVLKVNNTDSYVKLADDFSLRVEDPVITISSKYGTGLVLQKGIIINNEELIQTSIPLGDSDAGSPLFNRYGEVIGINTSKSVNASVSTAVSAKALKEIYDKFKNISYDKIESITFDELKAKYYYLNVGDESIKNNIPEKKWNEFSKIGDIDNNIKLELVKSSYKNGAISLRYKNAISEYMSSMKLSYTFRKKLIDDGFKEILNSETKAIYRSDKYQVVIMDEFDYLIIVMVTL